VLIGREKVCLHRSSECCYADAGSRRSSGRALNIVEPATANARRPNVLRRCRGTVSWWRAAERRCRRVAIWATGMQQFDRYTGALPSRHRWVSMPRGMSRPTISRLNMQLHGRVNDAMYSQGVEKAADVNASTWACAHYTLRQCQQLTQWC